MNKDEAPFKLNVDLSGDQIKKFVAEAILHQLDETTRNALIAAALEHLLTVPKSRGYNSTPQPSPLQAAFNDAVQRECRNICVTMLEGEMHDQVVGIVREAMERTFAEGTREKVVTSISHAMGRALWDMDTFVKDND